MKSFAIVLMIAGLILVVYGGINYGQDRTTIEVGSMTASVTEHHSAPLVALIIGGIALVGGLVLFSAERRRA
jgi:uncharacterized membrane protein YidH (DUF202 family)